MDKECIFDKYIETLKKTSLDKQGTVWNYMTQSELPVINFDKVKNEYVSDLHLATVPSSNDALYRDKEGYYYFIEFKNGKVSSKKSHELQKKIYDSLLIFNDILDVGISYCRENVDYILVYNEEKNPEENNMSERSTPPSLVAIAGHFANKAGKSFVRFGLEPFERMYFRKVNTYTEREFEEKFVRVQQKVFNESDERSTL